MKSNFKSALALLLAAVTVLALPLNAAATGMSGMYGNISWVANTGGSTSSLYTKLETSVKAFLALHYTPTIKYQVNGETILYGTIVGWVESSVAVKTFTYNPTYAQIRTNYLSAFPNEFFPSNGYFTKCAYTSKINSQAVISNVFEYFV